MTEPATVPTQPGEPPPPPRRRRGRETVGDMVRSLAVVLVLVGIIVGFNLAQQPEAVRRSIDYPAEVAAAAQQVPYELLAPQPLPRGWHATSARVRSGEGAVTWHLGLVTPSGDYAAVEQTDGERRAFVEQFADDARAAGEVSVDDVGWERLEDGDPEPRALVREQDGVTTVVAGTAPWDDLERLVALLR